MLHLRFDCMEASYDGEYRHPQRYMRENGIVYENAIPQSLGDQWWFFNCQLDGKLPKYLSEIKADRWMVNNYDLPVEYVNE